MPFIGVCSSGDRALPSGGRCGGSIPSRRVIPDTEGLLTVQRKGKPESAGRSFWHRRREK